jgi:hypothetical protein
MEKIKRNNPCPCGSGKKYKDCCYLKNFKESQSKKIIASFTMDDGSKKTGSITSIDSLPKHNLNGITPNITIEQMMDLCIDDIYKIIIDEKVGMLIDLVDKVILEMDIVPEFTYRQVAERIKADGRFEIFQSQICSLKGTDPVELIARKLTT